MVQAAQISTASSCQRGGTAFRLELHTMPQSYVKVGVGHEPEAMKQVGIGKKPWEYYVCYLEFHNRRKMGNTGNK